MKINLSVSEKGTQRNWPRAARQVIACGLLAFGVGTASAQIAISTLAGANIAGSTDATGTLAKFSNPAGVAVDSSGNIYIADAANHKIRKITSAGVVTTLAGTGVAGSADNATGTSATFNAPQGVAVDSTGANLYVADTSNHTIRKIVLSGVFPVTTIAGLVGTPTSGNVDNATSTTARFNGPIGIVVDSGDANLYIADTNNSTIRRLALAGGVTTYAGTGVAGFLDHGTATSAQFNKPQAIAADATNLYVADTLNQRIRKIIIGGAVSTMAGTGTAGSVDNATGTSASFSSPGGIVAKGLNVYVADTLNNTIRQIVISSGAVTTIAGTAGSAGTGDGVSTAARFNGLSGIGADTAGNLYISDTNSQTIRKSAAVATPVIGSSSASVSVAVGANPTFSVSGVTGNPTPTYQWQRNPLGTGSFANLANSGAYSGVTTATLTITGATLAMSGDQFQCVVTNSINPAGTPLSTATSTARTLTVTQVPAITSAASVSFPVSVAGTTFTVTASGSPAPTFGFTGSLPPWASLNVTTGVISGTPPNTTGSPFSFTLTSTNSAGSAPSQAFTLTVTNGAVVSTPPTSQNIALGSPATFTVVASGTPTITYQWQRQAAGTSGFVNVTDVSPYSGSTTASLAISATTLAMNGDQFQVVVNNGIGSAATSTPVTLTVTQAPVFTSAASTTFAVTTAGTFTATATGSPAPIFGFTGSLPSWASLNTTTGALTGTPPNTTGSPFSFTLTATSTGNAAVTQAFILTVSPTPLTPTFSTQPIAASVSIGQPATYTVVATGTPAPTYKWQRQAAGTTGFVDLVESATYVGTATATLIVNNATTGMSTDQFLAIATNTTGSTSSTAVTLTVTTGTVISTLAGKATLSGTVDGTGILAQFNNPFSVAVDASGNVYVADSSSHTVRKVTAAGVVTTLAGKAGVSGSTDATGGDARFFGPSGIAVDAAGNVYVADQFNHTIRLITSAGVVNTIAGAAGINGFADGAVAAARFSFPSGVAVDSFGSIYVADTNNHTIRRFTISGFVSTLAGLAATTGTADGTGTAARFNSPSSLAVDGPANVYVADASNNTIRKITQAGVVTTLAGGAGLAGTLDDTGTAARFSRPSGVAVDSLANVYVADTFNSTIRKITSAGVVTTVAGLGGSSGTTDSIGSAARFTQPRGIAVDTAGNLYVADTGNHTIRRSGTVTAPAISTQPLSTAVAPGGNATFTVVATGAPTPTIFQWKRQPAGTTGFVNIVEGAPYTGTTTATLTVTGITSAMQGDQFQVSVGSLVSPDALSTAATLSAVVAAPVFTSAASASVQATQALSFTVAASGNPTPTFSATGLPSWATLNATTGALTGTPPDTTGSPFTVTLTAGNGISVGQTFTLTVTPAIVAPAITTQPASATVIKGQNTTFTVVATGTAPLTYQWRFNGVAVAGATSASLALTNLQPADAGTYGVVVSNAASSVISDGAALIVNTQATVTSQPKSQAALAGSSVTFSVTASGNSNIAYQWRKNGANIAGATSSSFTLPAVTTADAGNYDVVVTTSFGALTSSLAQLSVSATASVPTITAAPVKRTALIGSSTTFTAGASGAPAPTYQWLKNGVAISGATGASFTIGSVQAGDIGNYSVTVTNSAGSITSAAGELRAIARSYAGTYFGSFGGTLGNFAIFIRSDNTGVFLAYLPGSTIAVRNLSFNVNDSGQFVFTQTATGAITAGVGGQLVAAAPGDIVFSGAIAADGTLAGTVVGVAGASLAATKSADAGATQAVSGFYQAGAANSSSTALTIVSAAGQAFVVTQTSTTVDGGSGSVSATGVISVATARQTISGTVNSDTAAVSVTATAGTVVTTFTGASEAVIAAQRLANISTRARVGTGDAVSIAGFVISGTDSKPVLIRAVGPTLIGFGVPTALTAPKLDLYRGSTVIATNTGWATAGNTAAITAASAQAGAFALAATSADSVIFTTLAPGAYTAIVSSSTGALGVALVEVYDLSAPAAGQKLFNISTRASAGTGDATLIAGIVVSGSAPKRVLIRAVGPGLIQLGVTGVLAQPQLVLIKDGVTVAQNTGWGTSPDASAIAIAATQVGAFPLIAGSGDSALIVSLAPGNYSAQVLGVGGTSGVAIVEVYELP